MNSLQHETYMRRAIELAGNVPELPFGAVIADPACGRILAEGWNRSSLNPTWHGEIDAINHLVRSQGASFEGRELTLYTTAEPCPMCMGAILWCGLGAVVFGTSIAYLQACSFMQIPISTEEIVLRSPQWNCTILGGVLRQECDALFRKNALGPERESSYSACG